MLQNNLSFVIFYMTFGDVVLYHHHLILCLQENHSSGELKLLDDS